MNNFPTTNNNSIDFDGIKSMFNKPGGTFAKITAVGAVAFLGYGLYKALPYLITFAENTIVFILEMLVLAAIVAVLLNRNTWKWISLFWLQVTKKIYGFFVRIDPISILEQNIEKMKRKLYDVKESSTKLASIIIKMEEKLKKYEKEFEHSKRVFEVTKERIANKDYSTTDGGIELLGLQNSLGTSANDVKAWKQMFDEQTKSIEIAKKYQTVVNKLCLVCTNTVTSAERELSREKDRYESAKQYLSLTKTVESLMHGGEDEMLNNMALEHVNDTINLSMAKMESFITDSQSIFNNYNLDTAINIKDVDAMLEQYQNDDKFMALINNEQIIDVAAIEIHEPEKVLVNKGTNPSSKYFN